MSAKHMSAEQAPVLRVRRRGRDLRPGAGHRHPHQQGRTPECDRPRSSAPTVPMALRVGRASKTIALEEMPGARPTVVRWLGRAPRPLATPAHRRRRRTRPEATTLSDPDIGRPLGPAAPRAPGTPETDDPAEDGDDPPIETRPQGDDERRDGRVRGRERDGDTAEDGHGSRRGGARRAAGRDRGPRRGRRVTAARGHPGEPGRGAGQTRTRARARSEGPEQGQEQGQN